MNEKLQTAVIQALESVQKGMPGYWQQLVTENTNRDLFSGIFCLVISIIAFILLALCINRLFKEDLEEGPTPSIVFKIFAVLGLLFIVVGTMINSYGHISDYYAPNISLIETIVGRHR